MQPDRANAEFFSMRASRNRGDFFESKTPAGAKEGDMTLHCLEITRVGLPDSCRSRLTGMVHECRLADASNSSIVKFGRVAASESAASGQYL